MSPHSDGCHRGWWLPPVVRAIEREGRKVIWVCDPMHANTLKSATGYKTRTVERILEEVKGFFAVHAAEGYARSTGKVGVVLVTFVSQTSGH